MDHIEYLEKLSNEQIMLKIKKLSENCNRTNIIKINFYLQELLNREGMA